MPDYVAARSIYQCRELEVVHEVSAANPSKESADRT